MHLSTLATAPSTNIPTGSSSIKAGPLLLTDLDSTSITSSNDNLTTDNGIQLSHDSSGDSSDDESTASSLIINHTTHEDDDNESVSNQLDWIPRPAQDLLRQNFLSFFSNEDTNETTGDLFDTSTVTSISATLPLAPPTFRQLIPHQEYHTLDDAVHLRLLNLCHELRAPLYAFDSILKWSQDAKLSGYQFPTSSPSRKTYMDQLYNRYGMHLIKPKEQEVDLFPHGKSATVVTFPFIEMAKSLLADTSLMQPENLLLPPYSEIPEDTCTDIHTGTWFKLAVVHLCLNNTDILCPIILFIDKTQVDKFSKWTLEPVLFTLGIFNRATRNLSHAWRPLGLITNTLRMSSASHREFGKMVRLTCDSYMLNLVYLNFNYCIRLIVRETVCKTTTAFSKSFYLIWLLANRMEGSIMFPLPLTEHPISLL
jgi:hypothetical protein